MCLLRWLLRSVRSFWTLSNCNLIGDLVVQPSVDVLWHNCDAFLFVCIGSGFVA